MLFLEGFIELLLEKPHGFREPNMLIAIYFGYVIITFIMGSFNLSVLTQCTLAL